MSGKKSKHLILSFVSQAQNLLVTVGDNSETNGLICADVPRGLDVISFNDNGLVLRAVGHHHPCLLSTSASQDMRGDLATPCSNDAFCHTQYYIFSITPLPSPRGNFNIRC